MEIKISGKAFVFGNNLDTDQIYPGRHLALTKPEEIKAHAMEGADPEFVKQCRPGDIIVAGTNFGCGSSREQAAITLKGVGVGAILAESFARIFYRNGINLGLPLVVCPEISRKASPGDEIFLDLEEGVVHNQTSGEKIKAQPLTGYVLEILENGGIKPLVKRQLEAGSNQPFNG